MTTTNAIITTDSQANLNLLAERIADLEEGILNGTRRIEEAHNLTFLVSSYREAPEAASYVNGEVERLHDEIGAPQFIMERRWGKGGCVWGVLVENFVQGECSAVYRHYHASADKESIRALIARMKAANKPWSHFKTSPHWSYFTSSKRLWDTP